MKIAFNPSTVAALTTPPNNKDITFDLRGQNIFARGVKFYGTDTNTWRDIKVNNVSIGSHTLDLRNGGNTTLTNTNGVVTINSTWRPVVDSLTSDSTTSSLSAKQGKVLKALIDSKSDSGHNHDNRYLKLTGGTLTGNLAGTSATFSGRFYGNGDDEGIIIKPASNGYAGLTLGAHDGERSVFYFTKGNPFWRYNNGSVNLDIKHPKKAGTIALTSDIPTKSSWNYDDRYLRLSGGTMNSDALIKFADSGSWGTDKGPQGARGGLYWLGQSDYAKLYAEETTGDNLDLVIRFGDDNSNGLSIRNKSNVQTSYISAGGVITTSTFKGNLDWSYITNKPATATRWPSWAEVTGKPSSFTPSTHTHGLSNSVFFLHMPSISGNAKWKEVFGYPVNYNLLLSVRINSPAPEWCVGNYGSGILYGGSDTKGFMSSAYREPLIMWAGGNGGSDDSVPKWYIGIRGTHKSIYNLTTIASEANAAYNLRHSHANKSVLDGITSGLVSNWNTAYTFVHTITGTDTDNVINKWDEIVNFLAGITEDNKLNTLLNSKLSIQQLSAKDILTTKTNNALFWVNTVGTASSITTGPFTDHPYALLSVTNYSQNDTNGKFFYRSRLAFSSAGDIKVASCHHAGEYKQDDTWYNVLTSKNSGISGSTIKLNGTSITVYSSGTADGRYVKKSGDTMSGALNFANGTWNKVGDDIYMGDHNIGGQLCLMGITGNTGISFHKQGDVSIRKSITFNGSTLYMNGNCDYASLANQSNLLAMNTVPNKTTSTSVGSWSPISGRYVFHQRWSDTSTGSDGADFGIYLDGNLTANMVLDGYYNSLLGFRVIGATGGFLKANGTIDHNTYLTSHQSLSNYYTKGEINTKLNNYLPLSGGTMKGQISSTYSVGTWIGGCTNAIIKAVANGYNSLICAPIKSGNVCISAWTAEDNLNFGYAKKGKTENNFDTRMYWDAPNNTLHATAFAGHLYGTADNAVNSDTTDGVHLEWSGELGANDYSWLAGWTNDGKKIKAVNKNQFATSGHTHDGRYVRAFGTSNDNIDSDWGQSFKTFDPIPSGTPPEKNPNISLLSIGENFNRRKQLAFTYSDDNIYYRRHTERGFSNWRRLAFANEIPSSLKNPYSFNVFGVIYDGSAAKTVTTSTFISQVTEAASTITDGTMLITSYASNSGFADTNAVNVPYKRKAVHLWEYIKAKTDSLYATKDHNHDNKYLRWLGNANQSNMNAIGRISHSSGMTALADPGNTTDNPMEGGSKSTSWHLYWQTNYTADPSGSNAWVAQIVNRAGTDRWWVRSRNGGTITNGTGWASNWRFLVTAPTSGLGNGNQPIYINSAGEVVAANSYPTSLRSPHALTLKANGTTLATYDGSSAKEANFTYANVGAASANHNHDDRYVRKWFGVYGRANKFLKLVITDEKGWIRLEVSDSNNGLTAGYGIYMIGWSWHSQDNTDTLTVKCLYANASQYVTALKVVRTSRNNYDFYFQFVSGSSYPSYTINYSNSINSIDCTVTAVATIPTATWTSSLAALQLNASQVDWSGIQNKPSTFNPAPHTHTWTSITDKLVAGNEFNIVNAGFKEGVWFNYLPINDRSKTATVQGYHFGNGAKGYASIKAAGFIKNGSNSSYVLLGDGGHKTISSLSVNYANSAGSATNAYHLRINSANSWSTWNWAGQSGQPSWLWGSNDGTNMYVWNPSNFNVNTAKYLRSLGNQNCQTGRTQAYGDVYTYNTHNGNTGSPTTYSSVIGFGRGTAGTVEIAGGWWDTNLYWRSLRDCCEDWHSWRTVLDESNYASVLNNTYLPLAGGTMKGGARISHGDGPLYIGRADNNSWLYVQDMASQAGEANWKIYANGSASFKNLTVNGPTTLNSVATLNGLVTNNGGILPASYDVNKNNTACYVWGDAMSTGVTAITDALDPKYVSVYYSNDNGASWTNFNFNSSSVFELYANNGSRGDGFYLGHGIGESLTQVQKNQLMVTFEIPSAMYSALCWASIDINAGVQTTCTVEIIAKDGTIKNTFTKNLYGWNALNYINFWGNNSQVVNIGHDVTGKFVRFKFKHDANNTEVRNAQILKIRLFSFTKYNLSYSDDSSRAAYTGHLYTYDKDLNTTFPNGIKVKYGPILSRTDKNYYGVNGSGAVINTYSGGYYLQIGKDNDELILDTNSNKGNINPALYIKDFVSANRLFKFNVGLAVPPVHLMNSSNADGTITIQNEKYNAYYVGTQGNAIGKSFILADNSINYKQVIVIRKGVDGEVCFIKDAGEETFRYYLQGTQLMLAGDHTIQKSGTFSYGFDDGKARFIIYSEGNNTWYEFYCG